MGLGPVRVEEEPTADWESLVSFFGPVLGRRGIRSTDEFRRATEDMGEEAYAALTSYERRVVANETMLVEKGLLTHEEVDRRAAELQQQWNVS
jgi:nitrile hydratase subunit beta